MKHNRNKKSKLRFAAGTGIMEKDSAINLSFVIEYVISERPDGI